MEEVNLVARNKDLTWYTPVCDTVLKKIYRWGTNYHQGDPSADRPFMNMNGRITDRITRHANVLRFTQNEIDHLVRLLDAVASDDPLSTERLLVNHVEGIQAGLKKGKLLPGGEYEIVLDDYLQDVMELFNMLVRAKNGVSKTVGDLAQENIKQGKSPFEL
jgi:hypothetical protein